MHEYFRPNGYLLSLMCIYGLLLLIVLQDAHIIETALLHAVLCCSNGLLLGHCSPLKRFSVKHSWPGVTSRRNVWREQLRTYPVKDPRNGLITAREVQKDEESCVKFSINHMLHELYWWTNGLEKAAHLNLGWNRPIVGRMEDNSKVTPFII